MTDPLRSSKEIDVHVAEDMANKLLLALNDLIVDGLTEHHQQAREALKAARGTCVQLVSEVRTARGHVYRAEHGPSTDTPTTH